MEKRVNLSYKDKELLSTLCYENKGGYEKVIKLLDAVQEYELKNRRTGMGLVTGRLKYRKY